MLSDASENTSFSEVFVIPSTKDGALFLKDIDDSDLVELLHASDALVVETDVNSIKTLVYA